MDPDGDELADSVNLSALETIERWLDEHGRSGDPMLDGLRYAAAHRPNLDVTVVTPPTADQ